MKITIKEVQDPNFSAPVSYWVDVPCDFEMGEPQVKRIRIPREMARYLKQLQDSNHELKKENTDLRLAIKKHKYKGE